MVLVTAFVDWNFQIHCANPPRGDPTVTSRLTLDHLGRVIGRTLYRIDQTARFDVSLRVYHGWHKGFQPTENRRALTTAANSADFAALSKKANVQIRPDLLYGDRLLSALDKRLHPHLGIHVPNTLRNTVSTKIWEEKMVDTAIAADIVDLAHREPTRWLMVIGDDDDLVPPVFAAEAICSAYGGRALIVRSRPKGQFLKLDGILEVP